MPGRPRDYVNTGPSMTPVQRVMGTHDVSATMYLAMEVIVEHGPFTNESAAVRALVDAGLNRVAATSTLEALERRKLVENRCGPLAVQGQKVYAAICAAAQAPPPNPTRRRR